MKKKHVDLECTFDVVHISIWAFQVHYNVMIQWNWQFDKEFGCISQTVSIAFWESQFLKNWMPKFWQTFGAKELSI